MELEISIAAEKIFQIAQIPITNSLLTTWLVMGFLIFFVVFVSHNFKEVPSRLQALLESVVGGLYSLVAGVAKENTKEFFPLVATFFIYIIALNWSELLPGVGSIGFLESSHGKSFLVPLFRGPTADLNTTLAFALISVFAAQYYGIKKLGVLGYSQRFLNIRGPADFVTGVLELISEISKLISFSFRLFGNLFAGEVLLTVVAFLIPFIAPIPFLGLEIFVGFIQALVFAMLTLVFLNIATESHGGL